MMRFEYGEIMDTQTYECAQEEGRLFDNLDAATAYAAAFGGEVAVIVDYYLDEFDEYYTATREYIVL